MNLNIASVESFYQRTYKRFYLWNYVISLQERAIYDCVDELMDTLNFYPKIMSEWGNLLNINP